MAFWKSIVEWQRTGEKAGARFGAEQLVEQGVEARAARGLVEWVAAAAPRELRQLNAYYLAERLGCSRDQVLARLAPATVAGLFHLNWEVRCPACSTIQPAFPSLKEARSEHRCHACGNQYHSHMDDEVVVSFSVSEQVRRGGTADPGWRAEIDERYGHVTGHDILTAPAFRSLFVNEPLPTGESFQVRRVTLLFTDLGGSTALYARKGDPHAYSLVRGHFDRLQAEIQANHGVIVKTIGDSIMAVFGDEGAGLDASIGAQRALARFNEEQGLRGGEALLLRVGLHAGPCLLVTLNERLDYFGTTVNATSRLERLASPGEIVLTDEVWRGLDRAGRLDGLTVSQERATLRGLDDRPFLVLRVRVAG